MIRDIYLDKHKVDAEFFCQGTAQHGLSHARWAMHDHTSRGRDSKGNIFLRVVEWFNYRDPEVRNCFLDPVELIECDGRDLGLVLTHARGSYRLERPFKV